MKYLYTVLLLLTGITSSSQPGTPDPGFGTAGISLGPFSALSSINWDFVQIANKKLLATGTLDNGSDLFYLLRYDTNGVVDSTFGMNGSVIDSINSGYHYAYAICEQSDGKIIVGGAYHDQSVDIFLKRYDSLGVTDSTFGINGIVTADFDSLSPDNLFDMVIQPDGKIVICGYAASTTIDIVLMRFNANGSVDSAFGQSGKVISDPFGLDQYANAMSLQPDGKIVICGFNINLSHPLGTDLLVARFFSNGTLDSTFGSAGSFVDDIYGADDRLYSVLIQPDGKILCGGYTDKPIGSVDLLLRLDSAGQPDHTFDFDGLKEMDHPGNPEYIQEVMIEADGKIITMGTCSVLNSDISLSRYLNDGSVDSSFGTNGHSIHSIGAEEEFPSGAILQSDGKIVVTGSYWIGGIDKLFTSRYLNDTLSTSITNISSPSFYIFPQPVQTRLYVQNVPSNAKVTVYDLNGRIVIHQKSFGSYLDVKELEAGIYFLELQTKEIRIVEKFVKEQN